MKMSKLQARAVALDIPPMSTGESPKRKRGYNRLGPWLARRAPKLTEKQEQNSPFVPHNHLKP
jgi:hypothetical protein